MDKQKEDSPAAADVSEKQRVSAINPAHEQLMLFNESQRRQAWAITLHKSGESCGEATRTFFQMLDDKGQAYWHIACKNGRSYSVRVNNDQDGSTRIMDCELLKRLTGDSCFVRFSDPPPGWQIGK